MTPPLPPGFECRVEGDTDVIAWSNRRWPGQWLYCGGVLFWLALSAPFTLGLTYLVVEVGGGPPVFVQVLFLCIFWFSSVAGVWSLLGCLFWFPLQEEVRVGHDRVEFWWNGRRRETHRRSRIGALVLGRPDDDTGPGLYLLPSRSPVRFITWCHLDVAWLVPFRLKAGLYDALREAFARRGWALEYRNDEAPAPATAATERGRL